MPRRGRSASPSPRAPARSYSPPPPRQSYAPAPAPPSQPMMAPPTASAQPSMMKQMAVTAGGVAVGSTIGHVAGSAITGMMGGGSSNAPPPQDQQQQHAPQQYGQQPPQQQPYGGQQGGPSEPTGACAWEIKQFIKCAQEQSDISLCQGFNEAIKECKQGSGIQENAEAQKLT